MSEKLKAFLEKAASVGKGALIAGAGAALTYVSEYLAGIDFGDSAPVVGAMLAVVVNAIRKMITE